MRQRILVTVFLVVVLAGFAGACGSGTEPETAVGQPEAVDAADSSSIVVRYDEEIRATTEAIVELHGEKTGLLSVLAALERGYDFGQIRTGAESGGLGADGVIEASEPHDGRAGVVVLDGDPEEGEGAGSSTGSEAGPRPVSRSRQDPPEQLLDALAGFLTPLDVQLRDLNNDPLGEQVDPGHALIGAILSLGRSGYTLDQIVEALVLGTGGVHVNDSGCAVINPLAPVEPKGSYVSGCVDGADQFGTAHEDPFDDLEPVTTIDDLPEPIDDAGGGPVAWNGPLMVSGTQAGGPEIGFRGMLETMTFEVTVTDGIVDLRLEETHWWVISGSPENIGCVVRIVDNRAGSGPLDAESFRLSKTGLPGQDVAFELIVEKSLVIHSEGDTCWAKDFTHPAFQREAGSSHGSFRGLIGEWGVEGELSGGVTFQADA